MGLESENVMSSNLQTKDAFFQLQVAERLQNAPLQRIISICCKVFETMMLSFRPRL
jgi:hypothetical protein